MLCLDRYDFDMYAVSKLIPEIEVENFEGIFLKGHIGRNIFEGTYLKGHF